MRSTPMKTRSTMWAVAGLSAVLAVPPVLAEAPGTLSGADSGPATTITTTRAREADRVNLDLRDVSVRDALEALFRGHPNLSYVLDNAVTQNPVTVNATIHDQTFDAALNAVL